MNALEASWLGSWEAPWALGRGRRWGDPPWALAALSQAWLLGGREGRWPRALWKARVQRGPWVASPAEAWEPLPQPEWVALLRHGSSEIPAYQRGPRERELVAACWQALLEGDGTLWMSLGSVLLTWEDRLRWVALLGAVDGEGALHLPPYLDGLVPRALRRLPPGWWRFLLQSMGPDGRLLPQGAPPAEGFGWNLSCLETLRVESLPPDLPRAWACPLPGGGWMLDPRIRAWGRGLGPGPEGIGGLVQPSLALGGRGGEQAEALLQGKIPDARGLPPGWTPALRADLEAHPSFMVPRASGDPTLDRLRARWGGELPSQEEGYPPWGGRVHPCADPFHWMAEGRRALLAQELDGALLAFAWAHAHFERLGSPLWAERAAANAAHVAALQGDLSAMGRWRRLRRRGSSIFGRLDEAIVLVLQGDWSRALEALRELMRTHPDWHQPWILYAQRGLVLNERGWVEEALPHVPPGAFRNLLEAYLVGLLADTPEGLDKGTTCLWEFCRARLDAGLIRTFWSAWEACPLLPMRLELGLAMLERCPEQRTSRRLIQIQILCGRAGVFWNDRMGKLLPESKLLEDPPARCVLEAWVAASPHPVWIAWGPASLAGKGDPPPADVLDPLLRGEALPWAEHRGRAWSGQPLRWEGGVVGAILVSPASGEWELDAAHLQAMAPWVAKLTPAPRVTGCPGGGELLTDGSEPMATVLRELDQVAPTGLAVLIQGPTGSGKELIAREIHRRSGRSGPLVPVNCSAFAEGLQESELFGHVRGAFTGAARDRLGAIEAADRGTLFLDEVADLSPKLQSLFLRVLQEREVRPVGSTRVRQVDVRFLAATHYSLEELTQSGAFRMDLFYRLKGAVLALPPLQDRRHEFPYLVPKLVAQLARAAGGPIPPVAPDLPRALAQLSWPGNFRELRHVLERALLRCGGSLLTSAHFPELISGLPASRTWEEETRGFQRRLLLETLRRHRFQVAEAAKCLGLTRPAIYAAARRIRLDLAAERQKWHAEGHGHRLDL